MSNFFASDESPAPGPDGIPGRQRSPVQWPRCAPPPPRASPQTSKPDARFRLSWDRAVRYLSEPMISQIRSERPDALTLAVGRPRGRYRVAGRDREQIADITGCFGLGL